MGALPKERHPLCSFACREGDGELSRPFRFSLARAATEDNIWASDLRLFYHERMGKSNQFAPYEGAHRHDGDQHFPMLYLSRVSTCLGQRLSCGQLGCSPPTSFRSGTVSAATACSIGRRGPHHGLTTSSRRLGGLEPSQRAPCRCRRALSGPLPGPGRSTPFRKDRRSRRM